MAGAEARAQAETEMEERSGGVWSCFGDRSLARPMPWTSGAAFTARGPQLDAVKPRHDNARKATRNR